MGFYKSPHDSQDCLRAIEETFGIGYRVRGSKNGGVYPTVTGSLVTVNPGFTLPKPPVNSHEEGAVRNIPHNLMKYSETPLWKGISAHEVSFGNLMETSHYTSYTANVKTAYFEEGNLHITRIFCTFAEHLRETSLATKRDREKHEPTVTTF